LLRNNGVSAGENDVLGMVEREGKLEGREGLLM